MMLTAAGRTSEHTCECNWGQRGVFKNFTVWLKQNFWLEKYSNYTVDGWGHWMPHLYTRYITRSSFCQPTWARRTLLWDNPLSVSKKKWNHCKFPWLFPCRFYAIFGDRGLKLVCMYACRGVASLYVAQRTLQICVCVLSTKAEKNCDIFPYTTLHFIHRSEIPFYLHARRLLGAL